MRADFYRWRVIRRRYVRNSQALCSSSSSLMTTTTATTTTATTLHKWRIWPLRSSRHHRRRHRRRRHRRRRHSRRSARLSRFDVTAACCGRRPAANRRRRLNATLASSFSPTCRSFGLLAGCRNRLARLSLGRRAARWRRPIASEKKGSRRRVLLFPCRRALATIGVLGARVRFKNSSQRSS